MIPNSPTASREPALGAAAQHNSPSLPRDVTILDSTLREGEQGPGVGFTLRQRLQLAWMLDYFGVDAIEISPVISSDHAASCRELIRAGLSATIVAHVRALPNDIDTARRCDAHWVALYHAVSDLHLTHKLHVTREQALARCLAAVDYARAHGLRMRFTLEDASRADPSFLRRMVEELTRIGVDRLGIPDTVGALLPAGMFNLIRFVRNLTPTPLDVHCHNDLGLALANSLAGLEAGANQVHCTINGVGERNGIAALAEVAVALTQLYGVRRELRLDMLAELSTLLQTYTGIPIPANTPVVGRNAFRHKAGTHLAAILEHPETYEVMNPRQVGNRRSILFGSLSGRHGAAHLLRTLGIPADTMATATAADKLKELRVGDLLELELAEVLPASPRPPTATVPAAAT